MFTLEHPITSSDALARGKICLKAEESFLRPTFGRNPVAVCLANNHIFDYGLPGFQDTLRVLKREGIACFGAGAGADNYNNPLVINVGETSVGLLGYVCPTTNPMCAGPEGPGVAPLQLPRIKSDLKTLRARGVDRVVVVLHWGVEEAHLPRPQDVLIARAIIDGGADLVVGSHAHAVQAFEAYRGKGIYYGLGNCIFQSLALPIARESGTHIFRYNLKYWNRQSLAVTFAPASGDFSHASLRFSAGALRAAKFSVRDLHLPLEGSAGFVRYGNRFNRHVLWCRLRNGLFRTRDRLGFSSLAA